MDAPGDLLAACIGCLNRLGLSYAVLGAVARNAWAPPRASTDLDVTIEVGADFYDDLLRCLAELGIGVTRIIPGEPGDPLPDIVLLTGNERYGTIRRLDLLLAKTPFQGESIRRARIVELGDVACRVVTPEDLIVYKLIAARRRDLDDAADVGRATLARDEPIDWRYVEEWCRAWGIEDRLASLRDELSG